MCDGVGLPLIRTDYYDFRYPNANKLMLIVEGKWKEGTDTFDIKIPSDVRVCYDEKGHACVAIVLAYREA
jgi:hypothetical protein